MKINKNFKFQILFQKQLIKFNNQKTINNKIFQFRLWFNNKKLTKVNKQKNKITNK